MGLRPVLFCNRKNHSSIRTQWPVRAPGLWSHVRARGHILVLEVGSEPPCSKSTLSQWLCHRPAHPEAIPSITSSLAHQFLVSWGCAHILVSSGWRPVRTTIGSGCPPRSSHTSAPSALGHTGRVTTNFLTNLSKLANWYPSKLIFKISANLLFGKGVIW